MMWIHLALRLSALFIYSITKGKGSDYQSRLRGEHLLHYLESKGMTTKLSVLTETVNGAFREVT